MISFLFLEANSKSSLILHLDGLSQMPERQYYCAFPAINVSRFATSQVQTVFKIRLQDGTQFPVYFVGQGLSCPVEDPDGQLCWCMSLPAGLGSPTARDRAVDHHGCLRCEWKMAPTKPTICLHRLESSNSSLCMRWVFSGRLRYGRCVSVVIPDECPYQD